MDGENLGHHQKKMATIWQEILDSKKLQTLTYSEYLAINLTEKIKEIKPQECSWASKESELKKGIPFAYWNNPNNEIHQLQWKLTRLVMKTVLQLKQNFSNTSQYQNIRKELDQALFSCQYWWATNDPNWSPGMIKKGADKLLKVIKLACDAKFVNLDFFQKVESLYNKIISTAKEWDETKE